MLESALAHLSSAKQSSESLSRTTVKQRSLGNYRESEPLSVQSFVAVVLLQQRYVTRFLVRISSKKQRCAAEYLNCSETHLKKLKPKLLCFFSFRNEIFLCNLGFATTFIFPQLQVFLLNINTFWVAL